MTFSRADLKVLWKLCVNRSTEFSHLPSFSASKMKMRMRTARRRISWPTSSSSSPFRSLCSNCVSLSSRAVRLTSQVWLCARYNSGGKDFDWGLSSPGLQVQIAYGTFVLVLNVVGDLVITHLYVLISLSRSGVEQGLQREVVPMTVVLFPMTT